MRGAVCLPAVMAVLFFLIVIPATAQPVSISASPSVVHLGDTVLLSGNVSGIHTIAVYLFLTGPDLDSRGVTLENVNVPAGRGLFTTAPVNMDDGTWQYPWDTSVILGNLNPGTYTVFVVTAPVDHERFSYRAVCGNKDHYRTGTDRSDADPALPVERDPGHYDNRRCGAVFLSRQNKRG